MTFRVQGPLSSQGPFDPVNQRDRVPKYHVRPPRQLLGEPRENDPITQVGDRRLSSLHGETSRMGGDGTGLPIHRERNRGGPLPPGCTHVFKPSLGTYPSPTSAPGQKRNERGRDTKDGGVKERGLVYGGHLQTWIWERSPRRGSLGLDCVFSYGEKIKFRK